MRHSACGAFTLIEMLVVIAIIALLISIIVPSVNHGLMNARRTASLSNLRQIGTALNMYAVDHGRFPDQAGGSAVSVMVLAGKQGQAAGGGGASGAYGTPPSQRPLNPYLGFEDIPDNGEVPIVRSPADNGPDSWNRPARSPHTTWEPISWPCGEPARLPKGTIGSPNPAKTAFAWCSRTATPEPSASNPPDWSPPNTVFFGLGPESEFPDGRRPRRDCLRRRARRCLRGAGGGPRGRAGARAPCCWRHRAASAASGPTACFRLSLTPGRKPATPLPSTRA